jgi:hypothetical protein
MCGVVLLVTILSYRPFVVNGNFISKRYLQFLQWRLFEISRLKEIFPNYERDLLAETIYSYVVSTRRSTTSFWKSNTQIFRRNVFRLWIGRRRAIECLARSPDLTPVDLFLRGHVNRPLNIEAIKEYIRIEIADVGPTILIDWQQKFVQHIHYPCLKFCFIM